jgi:uncharacterized protein YnzC (UPF0291/DUF896 family)
MKGEFLLSTLPINALIERINELARKQKSIGLEEWEREEQEALRQEYLSFIRGQVKNSLDNIKIVNDTPKH